MVSHTFSYNFGLLKRLTPLLVVLFGFAMRVYAMDTAWIDGDRANPHGIGVVLLDALSRGDWRAIPLFSDDASIGLPNPPLLTYAYAIAALSGRGLSMANALGLVANTIAVVAAFAVGRRAAGWHAGLIAATLLAGSNWGVYLARGAWHPTPIESGTTLSVALLLVGLARKHPRLLMAGFVVAALTALTYVSAFILLPQALLATLASGAAAPGLRRVWWRGALICFAAMVLYGTLLFAGGRLAGLGNIMLLKSVTAPLSESELRGPDISAADRDPWGHFMRLATNAGYALTWTDPTLALYSARRGIEDGLALVLSTAAVAGLLAMAWRARERKGAVSRFLLVWAALPLLALSALVLRKADFSVPPYYLLYTSPVAHVAIGVAYAAALRQARSINLRRARIYLTAGLCVLLSQVSGWNFYAAARTVYAAPFYGHVDFMPLRWSQRLGRLWRDECPGMTIDPFWWTISLRESSENTRGSAFRQDEISSMWMARPEGGTCVLKQLGPQLPDATLLPLRLDDGSILRTYRSLPYAPPAAFKQLTVNLGWTLLDFAATERAEPGGEVSVSHVWRVDALPNEPHASWYFAPYVSVIAPDGQVVAGIDGAAAIEGWAWQQGALMFGSVTLKLPANLPPGDYVLRSTLFDPNQKKNAVYLDPAQPGVPILALTRMLRISP